MAKEELDKRTEEKVSGGSSIDNNFNSGKISTFGKEQEYECQWCHKKFKVMTGMADFSCPHCGYGGYKGVNDWERWYEEHKKDKK